jgi:hypothetical protein
MRIEEGPATIVVRAIQVGEPHGTTDAGTPGLRLRAPELEGMNASEADIARGGSTCLVLVDWPVISVSTVPSPKDESQRTPVRIPDRLLRVPSGFAYVAPRYSSWRLVRIEVRRDRLESVAPALAQSLARECNGAAARRIVDDSGIASIPSNLRIGSAQND